MKKNNKFFGKNPIYLDIDIKCFKCGINYKTCFESDWIIDKWNLKKNWKEYWKSYINRGEFEEFMKTNEIFQGHHFCEQCKVTNFDCDKCEMKSSVVDVDGWFIDYDYYLGKSYPGKYPSRFGKYKTQPANLCNKCRVYHNEGPITCERCWKRGEWQNEKWNDDENHVDCHDCEMILCYKCHDKLHYNK